MPCQGEPARPFRGTAREPPVPTERAGDAVCCFRVARRDGRVEHRSQVPHVRCNGTKPASPGPRHAGPRRCDAPARSSQRVCATRTRVSSPDAASRARPYSASVCNIRQRIRPPPLGCSMVISDLSARRITRSVTSSALIFSSAHTTRAAASRTHRRTPTAGRALVVRPRTTSRSSSRRPLAASAGGGGRFGHRG